MIQTLGTTTNFTIKYQDNFPNALQRAQKLKQTCEADFNHLRGWFGNSTGFGSGNRVTLTVDTKSLAWNNGYHSDGSSQCIMNHFDSLGTSSVADDAVQSLFVAEIIEVLMSYRNTQAGATTWHPGGSDGEGLSRVAAALLHPDGYYQVLGGPFVNGWLQSAARNDWVSTVESSDTDGDSFGISMLFLYWLSYQLGFSMHDIVSKGGNTLEATYQALTGNTGGYTAFTSFINPFFPIGQSPTLKTDNPFPLKSGAQRTVYLSFTEEATAAPTVAGQGTAHVSPFFTCPAKDYHYQLLDEPRRIRCTVNVSGFAQPVYEWKINGQVAPSFAGNLTPTVTVKTDDPNHPAQPTVSNQPVGIYYSNVGDTSTYQGMSDELDLYNQDYKGHETIPIEVSVHEKYASSDKVTSSDNTVLDAQAVVYESQYYTDGAKCRAAFEAVLHRYVAYKWIPIVFTLPDPPPDLYRTAQILDQIVNDIHELSAKEPRIAEQLTHAVATMLKVSPRLLAGVSAEKSATAG